jgi:hypothetical protein
MNARGPISIAECRDAFVEITGVEPEGRSLTALLRLPGLVGMDVQELMDDIPAITQPGSRWFVDDTFLNAVASEDLSWLIQDHYNFNLKVFDGIQHPLSDLGLAIAINKQDENSKVPGRLASVASWISENSPDCPVLIDVLSALRVGDFSCGLDSLTIKNQTVRIFYFESDEIDMSSVDFRDCYFERLVVSSNKLYFLPLMQNCAIERLESHHTREDLIREMIIDTEIEEYAATYSDFTDIKYSDTEDKIIAVCSILDKSFIQSRNGRKDSAMRRGLTPNQAAWVPSCLEVLRKHGVVHRIRRNGEVIWLPELSLLSVVRSILRNPNASTVEFIEEVRGQQ